MAITTSRGRSVEVNGRPTGFLYGSGYGKSEVLTAHADRAAVLLSEAFGLDIEKRGNSDGKSCGAHYDGRYCVGLGAREGKHGHVTFDAIFGARVRDAEAIQAAIPDCHGYLLDKKSREIHRKMGNRITSVTVYGSHFESLEEAFAWLKEWGGRFCPTLQKFS